MERTTVLAICGSLRQDSLHRALLIAVEKRAPGFRFAGADLIRDLRGLAGLTQSLLALDALLVDPVSVKRITTTRNRPS